MSAEDRQRRVKLTAWVLFASFVAIEQPGCGGIVREGADGGGVGGEAGFGELPPGKGGRMGGSSGATAKPACGNGRVDPGEECDTADFASATCSSQTMNALPAGQLACTTSCRISTGLCRNGGTGGATGTGGRPSTGGGPGSGGQGCYARGGVPDPDGKPGVCYTGDEAIKACGTQLSRDVQTHSSCEISCGCNTCASSYSQCASDGGCEWILACARNASGCTDIKSCYTSGCQYIIDTAGGLDSVGARIAATLLPCLSQQDCLLKCR